MDTGSVTLSYQKQMVINLYRTGGGGSMINYDSLLDIIFFDVDLTVDRLGLCHVQVQ